MTPKSNKHKQMRYLLKVTVPITFTEANPKASIRFYSVHVTKKITFMERPGNQILFTCLKQVHSCKLEMFWKMNQHLLISRSEE